MRRRRSDGGSVLMLYPAAVVIVLLLGAVVVDTAVVYLAQRRAHGIALDAANDAVGAGLDPSRYRAGEVGIDPDRARAVAARTVVAAGDDDVELVAVTVSADGAVTVTVGYRVERVFGSAIGAGDTDATIGASSAGRLTADG